MKLICIYKTKNVTQNNLKMIIYIYLYITSKMDFLPIDELISKCGRQYIVNMLPSLFIEINTTSTSIKDDLVMYDYTYTSNILNTIHDMEIWRNPPDYNSKQHIRKHLEDIQTIINIYSDCKDKLIINNYDYIVISYFGDFKLRYKNQISDYKSSGKSLYLDIQAVRIALIDEITRRQWNNYYSIFNTGIKYIGGLFLFKFSYNYLGSYFYSMKKMIGM